MRLRAERGRKEVKKMTKKEKAELKKNIETLNKALATLAFWVDALPRSEPTDCAGEAFRDFCEAYKKIQDKGAD